MIKHFLKVLTIFLVMIVFGLIGVFLVNKFSEEQTPDINTQTQLAK